MPSHPPSGRVQIHIFLISAVLISYQIVLVKMFSIQYWYHFAFLVISIALLGFGASGTCILFFKRQLTHRFSSVLFVTPFLLVLMIWANLYLNRIIAFNPLLIIWQPYEIMRLAYLSLSILMPFFLGALCIGLSFTVMPEQIHRLYFANLAGSGLGSLIILLSLLHVTPYGMLLLLSVLSIGASLSVSTRSMRKGIGWFAIFAVLLLYAFVLRNTPFLMSPFKDLAQAENLMNARKELEVFGPLGLVTVIESPAYHYLPDLSLNCPYPLPRQKGLFVDGNTVGAIHQFTGSLNDMSFMGYRTNSLPYHLLKNPDVLVVGGGGGAEILNAKFHQAISVSVLEMNRDIIHLMEGPYGGFGGNIYHPDHSCVYAEEARGFLQRTGNRYDLIHVNLLESAGSATAGVYSLHENYLLTTEALKVCLSRLKPGGILSVSRWIKYPPRDSIKLMATAIEAIERHGKILPARSMMMIRSWQTATLLVKNGVFHQGDIETARHFCKTRLFDVSYLPGIREEDTNIFNRLDREHFYFAAIHLLSSEKKAFYETYPFDIKPATDDKPFFSHFLKTDMLMQYMRSLDRDWIPFMDWGYILVWMAVFILFLFGMVFILIPIPLALRSSKGLTATFLYFGAIGLAYMFLEMSMMQQFIRYLYDPVFSASVVIGSFLVYSGIGSLLAGKVGQMKAAHIVLSVLFIVFMGVVLLTSDRWLQDALAGVSLWKRMVACSLLIAPLAIPMGIPFPSGLSTLTGDGGTLIPWAWGINGFFSVMGSSATVLIAIAWGFKSVMVLALMLYLFAALVFPRLQSKSLNKYF